LVSRQAYGPRAIKLVGIFLAFLTVLVLALLLWIRNVEQRGWAAMEARVQELTRQERSRRWTRSVLRGPAAPGNAWDEYLLAFAETKMLLRPAPLVPIPQGGTSGSVPSPNPIEQFLKTNGSLIEHMRRGTQYSEVLIPVSSDPKASRLSPDLGNWDMLWQVGAHHARLLATAGAYQEAAERLTDLCLLGCDISHNAVKDVVGPGSEMRRHALDELRLLVVDRKLPRECLLALERELEILDRVSPDPAYTLLNDTAQLGRTFLLEPSWETALRISKEDTSTFDWRHAFSKRLLALDLFNRVDEWNQRAAGTTAMPWPEAARVYESIRVDLSGRESAFTSLGIGAYAWAPWMRAMQAKVRLLRVAVHFRLVGEVLPLGDPFGEQLHCQGPEHDHLKVWSLGAPADGELEGGPWADGAPTGKDHLALEVDR
jgi:hypothetical protein